MSGQRGPLLTRIGPLGVVAVVWVAIAVLFPSTEPDDAVSTTAAPALGATSPAGAGDAPAPTDERSATPGVPAQNGSTSSGGGAPAPSAGGTTSSGGTGPVTDAAGTAHAGTGDAGEVAAGGTAPAAAPSSEPGTTRGGRPCGEGVRQIPVSSYAVPCQPAWSGDNGGATSRGVAADKIIVVERRFPESANSRAVDGVQEQAGIASDAQNDEVFEVFKQYFNEQFELYGREVEWVRYESRFGNSTDEAQSKGREEACLDADVVANEIGAFAVVGTRGGSVSGPFAECAAQRGVVVLQGAAYFPERFYRELHPYVWNYIMECERISYQVAEYIGKRLGTKNAKWAGDPLLASQPRKYGVYVPNNDEYQHCVDINGAALQSEYGIPVSSRYNYTLDVSRFPDEAARGAVQFKADGVSTIIMACDPISAIFLTQSATSQAYYPEWLLIGVAAQDTDLYGQLYEQEQADGHMFGMSQLGETTEIVGPGSEPGELYEHITGEPIYEGASGGYTGLHMVYNLLQAAGPVLTPQAIADGAMTIPPGGAPDYPYGYWSFTEGPDGTPGAGDHTAVEDSREIYWTQSQQSAANGTPGTFVATYDGKRFRNGEWPAEDPPIYPEG